LKGILKILTALFIAAYLFVVLGFVGKQYGEVLCKGIEVIIQDSIESGLVTRADVINLVRLEHSEVAGIPISSVDATGIEESLKAIPAISNVQVYTNIEGKLMIEVKQRTPLARIEDQNHSRYYLDGDGYIIPATMDYTPHILHINGHIPGIYRKEKRIDTGEGGNGKNGMMNDLIKLSGYINGNPLWKSQIVQVYVNESGEFELIPRVGSQLILFGNADQMETKFFKLETLYREGFSNTGWNQYEIINLKYNNQVICTKR
jgi:cell division protein FtsQ